jgi:hypothetical protein
MSLLTDSDMQSTKSVIIEYETHNVKDDLHVPKDESLTLPQDSQQTVTHLGNKCCIKGTGHVSSASYHQRPV